jgi:hypothetical protein
MQIQGTSIIYPDLYQGTTLRTLLMKGFDLWFGSGGHACHLFQSLQEQEEVVFQFFGDGLARGEHCVFITTLQPREYWYERLGDSGIDVAHHLETGALNVIDSTDWYESGKFNSVVKARELWGMIEGQLPAFSGVRIAGDAAWAMALPIEDLCHWEATVNLVYEDAPVRAICQYDLNRHVPQAIHSALRTHANVIMDGQLLQNPFYEAAWILENEPYLNGSDADAHQVREMLEELRGES